MTYEVVLTGKARKQLSELPKKIRAAIGEAIEGLREGLHHNCKKLAGPGAGYRLRIGNYRVIFQIERGKLLIVVIKIAHTP